MQKWRLLIIIILLWVPGCDASPDDKTLLQQTEASYQSLEDCVMQAKRIDRRDKERLESELVAAMYEAIEKNEGSELARRTKFLVDAIVGSCNEEQDKLKNGLQQMDPEAAPAALDQINENLRKMLQAALASIWIDTVINTVDRIKAEQQ